MISNPAGRLPGDFMGTSDELAFLAGMAVRPNPFKFRA